MFITIPGIVMIVLFFRPDLFWSVADLIQDILIVALKLTYHIVKFLYNKAVKPSFKVLGLVLMVILFLPPTFGKSYSLKIKNIKYYWAGRDDWSWEPIPVIKQEN